MPLWIPVMKRELMNRMYSPSTYYFGRIASGLLFQLAYPAIIGCLTFWFLGINRTAANLFMFLFNCIGVTLNGCCIGFTVGIIFSMDENARVIVNLIAAYFQALSGVFQNLNQLLMFNQYVSYLSGWRYGSENFFRILSDSNCPPGVSYEEVLEFYGYTLGHATCFLFLYGLSGALILAGWGCLVLKYRKV